MMTLPRILKSAENILFYYIESEGTKSNKKLKSGYLFWAFMLIYIILSLKRRRQMMISVDEAIKKVMEKISPTGETEEVDLMEATGRVLAEDICSDIDISPFDKSAMDGYAVIAEECPGEFEIIEVIPAGHTPQKEVISGAVSKIMTGAPVPKGADSVVMVEKTEETGKDRVKILTDSRKGKNIIQKGEDVKAGDPVLRKGTYLSPGEIASLATVGRKMVRVFRRVKAAVLATGTELVEPTEFPLFGKIRNSNSYSLSSQTLTAGAVPNYLGIASDREEELKEMMKKGLDYDMFLISGGVSVGDFDFVPKILRELGVDIVFHNVRMKPGKPLIFGLSGRTAVFGMPGNPVSTLVAFELFVRPAIYRMSGREVDSELFFSSVLAKDYKRKRGEREQFVPVRLFFENRTVKCEPVKYHGSAHILSLPHANGLMRIPVDVLTMSKGEECQVRWLFH